MDSPPINLRKKPTKIEEMSKEQIRQTILKKRESNAKAQCIVENLLQKDISETYFLECMPEINQSHFDDVIQERSIIHICGYPLCDEPVFEKDILKQKYRISVKSNKIYDISARKSFCSNRCYNAAIHVKKQMLTSPLWLRGYEDIPNFHLLPLGSEGNMGQEIDVSIIDKVEITEQPAFTSVNDFAKASLSGLGGRDQINNDTELLPQSKETASNAEKLNSTDNFSKTNKYKSNLTIEHKNLEGPEAKPKAVSNAFNIVGEIVERPEWKIDPILTYKPQELHTQMSQNRKVQQKKQPVLSANTIEVERCLAEWLTIDTIMFLLGEEKVKELVIDKGESIKNYMNNYAQTMFSSNSYDKYQALCRKLNMLVVEDRKIDSETKQRELKPLPDYSILQKESKQTGLKIKAYLEGKTEVLESTSTGSSGSEDINLTQLPLVDRNAQYALRRKIVCQHLNKVLPDLLHSLGLQTFAVSDEVKLLVNTFKLTAKNVMFKPIQWTLIAVIILKLLALLDRRLENSLTEPTALRYIQLLLLSYKQDGGYVDRLIPWLMDIDRLLDSNKMDGN